MASQHKLRVVIVVLCSCILMLLVLFSMFLTQMILVSREKFSCISSNHDGGNVSWNTTFDSAPHADEYTIITNKVNLPGDLRYYLTNTTILKKSDLGMLIWRPLVLWQYSVYGGDVQDTFFNTTFTMHVNQTQGLSLVFIILSYRENPQALDHENGSLGLSYVLSGTANDISGSSVAVKIGTAVKKFYGQIIGVNVTIEPKPNSSAAPSYSVWIRYEPSHHLFVYVDAEGKPKPLTAIAEKLLSPSNITNQKVFVGFFSSMGKISQLKRWVISYGYSDVNLGVIRRRSRALERLDTSVPVAVFVAIAGIVPFAWWYIKSRFRVLKNEIDQLDKAMQRLPGMPRKFGYLSIKKAAQNFATELGSGAFGAVYRGKLPSGTIDGRGGVDIAIKRFMRHEDRCYADFYLEVSIINRLRHSNIVPLVGWSYKKREFLLIYEYMGEGSLDQHVFRKPSAQQQKPTLAWEKRYNITSGVAAGLHYVHHEYEQVVLHRDIKTSNILLDTDFNGRLGDFGISCVVAADKNSYTDHKLPGTLGFRAPEYIQSCKATRKTDIYAFGVLILEIVTGKRAIPRDVPFDHISDWAWSLHEEGRLLEAVDAVLTTGEFDAEDAERLLLLGLACSNPNPSDRPGMPLVVQILAKSVPPPDVPPVKPTFVWPPEGGAPSDLDDAITGITDEASGSNQDEIPSGHEGDTAGVQWNGDQDQTKITCESSV